MNQVQLETQLGLSESMKTLLHGKWSSLTDHSLIALQDGKNPNNIRCSDFLHVLWNFPGSVDFLLLILHRLPFIRLRQSFFCATIELHP